MGRETGLTKREQQTARRKLLALGVIQIERRGWRNTYHFRIVWERLEQVIQQSQRKQNVPATPEEWEQNVSTEPIQNVPTQPPQNVATERTQNVATQDRDYNTENKEPEITTRENQTIWNETREKLRAALPPGEAETRLTGTTLLQVTDTAACIGVPSTSVLVWLERRMYGQIANAIKGVLGKDLDLQFVATP